MNYLSKGLSRYKTIRHFKNTQTVHKILDALFTIRTEFRAINSIHSTYLAKMDLIAYLSTFGGLISMYLGFGVSDLSGLLSILFHSYDL